MWKQVKQAVFDITMENFIILLEWEEGSQGEGQNDKIEAAKKDLVDSKDVTSKEIYKDEKEYD